MQKGNMRAFVYIEQYLLPRQIIKRQQSTFKSNVKSDRNSVEIDEKEV